MKTVYLVRHGESEANVSGTLLGGAAPLTARGREQARFIAERAAKLPIDAIVASTMKRAQETADFIARRVGLQYEESDLFCERQYPRSLVGRSRQDPGMNDVLKRWHSTFYGGEERVEEGENFADVKERAVAALRYLEKKPEEHILVATHGFFIRVLLAHIMLGESFTPVQFLRVAQTVRTENTGISILEYFAEEAPRFDDYPHRGWRMRVWNDHAHLG